METNCALLREYSRMFFIGPSAARRNASIQSSNCDGLIGHDGERSTTLTFGVGTRME